MPCRGSCAAGIDPTEVGTVVMTHLHSDHASGIAEFPGATFVLSSAEWEAASKGRELDGYIKRQYDHAFDYRTLDFEGRDADSFASVRPLLRPLRRRQRAHGLHPGPHPRPLRGGAAAGGPRGADLRRRRLHDEDDRGDHLPFKMADEHRFRRSLKEIQRYIEQTPDAVVIPGHDMAAWRRLDSRLLSGPGEAVRRSTGSGVHTSVSPPPTSRKSDFCVRAPSGGTRCAARCGGSLPARGGTLPVGAARASRLAARRAQRAGVAVDDAGLLARPVAEGRDAEQRLDVGRAAGVERRAGWCRRRSCAPPPRPTRSPPGGRRRRGAAARGARASSGSGSSVMCWA